MLTTYINKNLALPANLKASNTQSLRHFDLFIVVSKFAMVQPWKIWACWIDLVFVVELSVVIFLFVRTAVLSIKTAFNLVKIHLLFRIMLLIQWSVIFLSSMLPFLGDWNIYPVCFPNICWHSWLKNQWKFV